jgi:hypothetical protein
MVYVWVTHSRSLALPLLLSPHVVSKQKKRASRTQQNEVNSLDVKRISVTRSGDLFVNLENFILADWREFIGENSLCRSR